MSVAFLTHNGHKNQVFWAKLLGLIWFSVIALQVMAHEVKLNKVTLYSDIELLNIFLHDASYQTLVTGNMPIEALISINHCQVTGTNQKTNADGQLINLNYVCDQPAVSLDFQRLFEQIPEYKLIFEHRNNQQILQQKLLTSTNAQVMLSTTKSNYSTVVDYLKLGADHIFQGFDHLFFLLALTLLLGWSRKLFVAIIGFTIGHGVAITLASFQIIHLDSQLVEIIIGWSIAVIALEAIYVDKKQYVVHIVSALLIGILLLTDHWFTALAVGLIMAGYFALKQTHSYQSLVTGLVTLVFGVYHGLGFSQLLLAQDLDLATIWKPLLGFNLGVEIGQVICVVLGYSIALLLMKYTPLQWHRLLREITAAIALTAGIYWFTVRTLVQFGF